MEQKGFTLVEILIVVAILALLNALCIPQYQRFLAKTRRAEGILLIQGIRKAQATYFAFKDRYVAASDLTDFANKTGFTMAQPPKFYNDDAGTAIWSPQYDEYHVRVVGNIDSDDVLDELCLSETHIPICGPNPRGEIVIVVDDVVSQ